MPTAEASALAVKRSTAYSLAAGAVFLAEDDDMTIQEITFTNGDNTRTFRGAAVALLLKRVRLVREEVDHPTFDGVIAFNEKRQTYDAMISYIFKGHYRFERPSDKVKIKNGETIDAPYDIHQTVFHADVYILLQLTGVEVGPESALYYFKQSLKHALRYKQLHMVINYVYGLEDKAASEKLRLTMVEVYSDPEYEDECGIIASNESAEQLPPKFLEDVKKALNKHVPHRVLPVRK